MNSLIDSKFSWPCLTFNLARAHDSLLALRLAIGYKHRCTSSIAIQSLAMRCSAFLALSRWKRFSRWNIAHGLCRAEHDAQL